MSQAILIADLGFGDAGKGSIVDFLARTYPVHTVVRYNGGAQAAHNVVDARGRHHTFSQFGSATFVPNTRTHLSRFMLVDPWSMFTEEQHLHELGISNAFSRTTVDEQALIITPFQQSANRLREMARVNRHGSCGMGIGETMADYLAYGSQVLFAGDLRSRSTIRSKLRFIQEVKLLQSQDFSADLPLTETVEYELNFLKDQKIIERCIDLYESFAEVVNIVDEEYFGNLLEQPDTVVFEGAQGVLLDEWYGFHPYTTWSTTTFANADTLLCEQNYTGDITKLGIVRAYATRHGHGPFVTEDAKLSEIIPDMHNQASEWQSGFRVGYFDTVSTRYALDVLGEIDSLAVTNLDRLADIPEWKICRSYFSDGSVLTGLDVCPSVDIGYQERLTQTLSRCDPHYETFPKSGNHVEDTVGYVRRLEQLLGVPVSLVSYGATAEDKFFWEGSS